MGQKAGHGDELLGLVISNSPSTSRSLDCEGPLAGGGTAVSAGDDRRGASAGCSGLLSYDRMTGFTGNIKAALDTLYQMNGN